MILTLPKFTCNWASIEPLWIELSNSSTDYSLRASASYLINTFCFCFYDCKWNVLCCVLCGYSANLIIQKVWALAMSANNSSAVSTSCCNENKGTYVLRYCYIIDNTQHHYCIWYVLYILLTCNVPPACISNFACITIKGCGSCFPSNAQSTHAP